MAYGKSTKPLVVGLPLDIKKGIEQIAAHNNIAEAEVVRRICRYLLNNPVMMERAINPDGNDKKSDTKKLFRVINCNPKQFLE